MALRRLFPLFLALMVGGALLSFTSVATAQSLDLAQQEGTENENAEGGEESDGEGQSDPDAETGANQGQSEDAATEEEGPPWTYQMARISIALILLMMVVVGVRYYQMVASRQQKGTT